MVDKFPVKLNAFTKAFDISRPDPLIEPDKKESDSFAVQNYSVTVEVKPRDYRFLRFDE